MANRREPNQWFISKYLFDLKLGLRCSDKAAKIGDFYFTFQQVDIDWVPPAARDK